METIGFVFMIAFFIISILNKIVLEKVEEAKINALWAIFFAILYLSS